MAPLLDHLRQRIAAAGPLTVADYMAEALGNPHWGYYITTDPLGAAGDFVTAPEISQMFGELLGAWCIQVWLDMGAPPQVTLVELGPGRGTLMADVLRAMAGMAPSFLKAATLHLVETSPVLRHKQAETLKSVRPIFWHDRLAEVPDTPGVPLLVLANEFFDALPIHQYQRTGQGWAERLVDVDSEKGGLRFVLGPSQTMVPISGRLDMETVPVGTVVDVCPAGAAVAGELAARLVCRGGAALVVDYGHAAPVPTDTLQALRRHRFVPVLETPGEADLTAHVDFTALAAAAAAAGAVTYGPETQRAFLLTLGLRERAAILRAQANVAQRQALDAAVHRLTASKAMGTLFKAMAIVPPGAKRPPGV